ncbi:MAG: hypothetical protein MJY83_06460 [Bacteroidales bacterium]|nr:hypothetical protein [Bacteroidales bacterium]
MKKIPYIILTAFAVLCISCKPSLTPDEPKDPNTEVEVDPTPEPDPEPEKPNKTNVIYVLTSEGKISKSIDVRSATSFVFNGGYFSFYLGSMEGLSPEVVADGYEPREGESIIAAAVLNSFNGKKIVFKEEKLRYIFQTKIAGFSDMDASETAVSDDISQGWFILTVNKDELKATLEFEFTLTTGSTIKAKVESEYTPGGENENFVTLGDAYQRPLRVGFYDEPISEEFEPTLYIAVGEIEYGEDLPRTTYIGIAAASKLCDGKPHDIKECIGKGTLATMFYSIEGHIFWDIIDGQIIISKNENYDYEISMSGAHATDEEGESPNTLFEMYWSGKFKDINITKPINSELNFNGTIIPLKSAVIGTDGPVSHVYLCPSEGITTIEAAKADNSIVITVSSEKVFTNVGLSTDREHFSISYAGNTWDKNTLDTCSYIVHEHSEDTFHCQIASFSLKSGKTTLKLEYKGPLTITGPLQ